MLLVCGHLWGRVWVYSLMLISSQFHPADEAELKEEAAEYHNEGFSPPPLLPRNVERHKPCDEIKEELKGLRDAVVSLSQKLDTLQVSSSQKGTPLPTVVAGLDPTGGRGGAYGAEASRSKANTHS
ncbi:hypothetical protein I79_002606 [Cricetulus griseus]|uniref:Uncharacterized protein n=1 Tax=Cricetulus griseus TaxID=10029 RepID=G3GXW2_CRIGR|nr:hypothetical protein I79_002606 [Cricetulus griseus]